MRHAPIALHAQRMVGRDIALADYTLSITLETKLTAVVVACLVAMPFTQAPLGFKHYQKEFQYVYRSPAAAHKIHNALPTLVGDGYANLRLY